MSKGFPGALSLPLAANVSGHTALNCGFILCFYWRLTCILMTMYLAELGYTIASASTLAIEARHAAWINSTVRKGNPPTTGFASSLFTSRPFSN